MTSWWGVAVLGDGHQHRQPGRATGLPAGLSMSANGVSSGAATVTGTTTVTVTAKDSTGATGSATFGWTVT